MPLTRRERRILRDIEADLIKDDPEFVRRMSANELEGEVSPHRLVMIGLAVLGLCIIDRKSTRLNSSHVKISYAVFCWKEKNGESGELRDRPRKRCILRQRGRGRWRSRRRHPGRERGRRGRGTGRAGAPGS